MKTLGIDLSSQATKTAACLLEWHGDVPHILEFESKCDDDRLDLLSREAEAIGIDAPFGWPAVFIEAMREWTQKEWSNEFRDSMTYRLTDRRVIQIIGMRPLRVAADRIAMPAMRARALLHRNGVDDFSGAKSGRFFEVYPAASLKAWGLLPPGSYKGSAPQAKDNRGQILAGLKERFEFKGDGPNLKSDHLLDALIAALTARAAKVGTTHQPEEDELVRAKAEGWIHIPRDITPAHPS